MKVIFEGDCTADVSAIQSVSVSKTAGRIKVCVKHNKKKMDKPNISYLAYPSLRYSRRLLPKSAETIKEELVSLSKAPDMPIEQVVESTAWRNGHLQVKMDTSSHASARGLALLCWDWPLNQNPRDENLEFRTGLRVDEIQQIAKTEIYQQSVKSLILETYKTADEFKWWIRDYGRNMLQQFGTRMRLSEDTANGFIISASEQHDVNLGNLRGSSAFFKPEKPIIGSGRHSVYLYYYQWDRDSAKSKGLNVWECKIGKTERALQERLKEQATDPENFRLGLHIQTDNPTDIEEHLRNELKERGKHLDESLRTEWFLTNPNEVERIYKRI